MDEEIGNEAVMLYQEVLKIMQPFISKHEDHFAEKGMKPCVIGLNFVCGLLVSIIVSNIDVSDHKKCFDWCMRCISKGLFGEEDG